MAVPLLQTKLYIPPPRPGLISRPRLIERLNAGLGRKLTLLSAPAGFGKTTLLSEWIHRRDADASSAAVPPTDARTAIPRVAWLSLDAGDNDLRRFLAYVVAALQTVESSLGEETLAALESLEALNVEAVLTTLLNEVVASSRGTHEGRPYVLVLDDYHAIEAQPIHEALAFLLDHLPPPPGGMHLVIATRSDPFLPLSRLRARGQMTDLRADDLRFSLQEMAAFFDRGTGLTLSEAQLATLKTRTEGWIAGLQLAALSIEGRLAALLRQVRSRGVAQGYADKLLAAFEGQEPQSRDEVSPALIEPLSARELDVLRLLRSELSGPEIAREVMISLNTVRTHTKNIYGKLASALTGQPFAGRKNWIYSSAVAALSLARVRTVRQTRAMESAATSTRQVQNRAVRSYIG